MSPDSTDNQTIRIPIPVRPEAIRIPPETSLSLVTDHEETQVCVIQLILVKY
jgi:hypothetical protein